MQDYQIVSIEKKQIGPATKLLKEMWLLHADNSHLISPKRINTIDIGQYLQEIVNDKNQIFLIATSNDKEIIGTIRAEIINNEDFYEEKRQIYMDDLFVMKGYRNQGVAGLLIKTVEKYAHDNGITLISCRIYAFNKESKELYQKMGYDPDFTYYSKHI